MAKKASKKTAKEKAPKKTAKEKAPKKLTGTVLDKLIPIDEDTEDVNLVIHEQAKVEEINPIDQMKPKEREEYISKAIIDCLESSTAELDSMLKQYRITDTRHASHLQLAKNKALLKILSEDK